MSAQDRLRVYSAMAETSRKWVAVMDAKAAFLSGLNAALLAFLWAGARFTSEVGWPLWIALAATLFLSISMWLAISVVLPRATLSAGMKTPMKYQGGFKPVSFYGFVASTYPAGKFEEFRRDVICLDEDALARESLEQHYVISHIVQQKSDGVRHAGVVWLCALFLAAVAMVVKAV